MCYRKTVGFCTICLLCLLTIWMMFQPLMSAYAVGEMESGNICVYGIGFLTSFGIQGILTVLYPILLLLLAFIQVDKKWKIGIWMVLVIMTGLAYWRSWMNAEQWLISVVAPEIEYYFGAIIYPLLMVIAASMVFLWIYRWCEDMEETSVNSLLLDR